MQAHLAEISATVAPDAHAVLLLDQAGWHLAGALVVPGNITLLPLPPRSPELNPVENVWQFMRDNWLSNRVFNGYDDIVAHCCAAWNDLIDQPWRIRSIGRRVMGRRVLINAGWYNIRLSLVLTGTSLPSDERLMIGIPFRNASVTSQSPDTLPLTKMDVTRSGP